MNRLRNLITGNSDEPDRNQNNNSKNNNTQSSSQSWNSKYGYNSNNRSNKNSKQQSRYKDDDLYLSDDDDWGMSTLRESDRYDQGVQGIPRAGHGSGSGERRSSSAFWDQSYVSEEGGMMHGESDGGGTEMPPGSSKSKNGKGLQEWEREAMMRDNLDGAFEIGNDDYYHSDTCHDHSASEENNAYAEVQEDIRSLEENEDDAASQSTTSSNKEEVVNAYRDYLKSIRDGGFESYLDTPDDAGMADTDTDFDNIAIGSSSTSPTAVDNGGYPESPGGDTDHGEDEAIDRVLDIEEERVSGSLYGDLYGVHDMRSATSPYSAWRAKAKALLQQEEERDRADAVSPSRQMLSKFRRKRSNGKNNGVGTPQKLGYDESRDDEEPALTEKLYRYKTELFQHPKFRGACIGICLMLALAAGLSYYGDKTADKKERDEEEMMANVGIPPKTVGNKQQQPNLLNPNLGPSDAIKNSIGTFDPMWYDRRSGWEGITFRDAINFCASKSSNNPRVPCPYEVYCSDGPSGGPYNGEKQNGEQWSPVSNGANQWVQVGDMFTCKRYTDLHDGKKPDWGITGISLEHDHGAGGITQNIMCCVDLYNLHSLNPFTEWDKQGVIDHVEGDSSQETAISAVVNVEDAQTEKYADEGNVAMASQTNSNNNNNSNYLDIQKREKAVIAAFQPIWFSSAHGWTGTSYEDGINFCESYNHMVLCPYAAYCPNGRAQPALPGSMITDLDGEEWVPANGPMNTWVQIGTVDGEESTKCTLHHELLGERPQWGIDGTREDVKHHIMCCLM